MYPLQQLNKKKYADIYAQQTKAKENLTRIQSMLHDNPHNIELNQHEAQARDYYTLINHSEISLMKHQSKVEWIGLGDECTRLFIARIKQRKAMTCNFHIYTRL